MARPLLLVLVVALLAATATGLSETSCSVGIPKAKICPIRKPWCVLDTVGNPTGGMPHTGMCRAPGNFKILCQAPDRNYWAAGITRFPAGDGCNSCSCYNTTVKAKAAKLYCTEIPIVKCVDDPCKSAMCPAHPNATCVAETCGDCKAVFYENGKKVTCIKETCALKVGEMRIAPCPYDPCKVFGCTNHTDATCEPTSPCGGCDVSFYNGDDLVTTCGADKMKCPNYLPNYPCPYDPCVNKTCGGFPEARCVPKHACGGCDYKFIVGEFDFNCTAARAALHASHQL